MRHVPGFETIKINSKSRPPRHTVLGKESTGIKIPIPEDSVGTPKRKSAKCVRRGNDSRVRAPTIPGMSKSAHTDGRHSSKKAKHLHHLTDGRVQEPGGGEVGRPTLLDSPPDAPSILGGISSEPTAPAPSDPFTDGEAVSECSDSDDDGNRKGKHYSSSPEINVTWVASPPSHCLQKKSRLFATEGSRRQQQKIDGSIPLLTDSSLSKTQGISGPHKAELTHIVDKLLSVRGSTALADSALPESVLFTQEACLSPEGSHNDRENSDMHERCSALLQQKRHSISVLANPHQLPQSPTTLRRWPALKGKTAHTSFQMSKLQPQPLRRESSLTAHAESSDRRRDIQQLLSGLAYPKKLSPSLLTPSMRADVPRLSFSASQPTDLQTYRKFISSDTESSSTSTSSTRASGPINAPRQTRSYESSPNRDQQDTTLVGIENSTAGDTASVDRVIIASHPITMSEPSGTLVTRELPSTVCGKPHKEVGSEEGRTAAKVAVSSASLDEFISEAPQAGRRADDTTCDRVANSQPSAGNNNNNSHDTSHRSGGLDDLESLLGDLDDEQLASLAIDPSPNASPQIRPQAIAGESNWRFKYFKRFVVLQVVNTTYQADDEMQTTRWQKVLQLVTEDQELYFEVALRDDWYHSRVEPQTIVNILGFPPHAVLESGASNPNSDEIRLDLDALSQPLPIDNDSDYLLISHPDILVTSTHLAEASSCLRRAVLRTQINEYVLPDNTFSGGGAAVMGTLIHQLFERCIGLNRWDDKTVGEVVRTLVEDNIHLLWEADLTEEIAWENMREVSRNLRAWANKYMHAIPQPGSTFSVHREQTSLAEPNLLAFHKVLDTEEFVWSPSFGLKGMIDVTVQGRISSARLSTTGWQCDRVLGHTKVYPLEVKTGKHTRHHGYRAQLSLYTLLLSSRYGIDISDGFLYFTKTNEMIRVPALRDEVRSLLIMRNDLAHYLYHNLYEKLDRGDEVDGIVAPQRLPEIVHDDFICRTCPLISGCLKYYVAFENGTQEACNLKSTDLWQKHVGHLSARQLEFFRHWISLVDKEECEMSRFRAELWLMSSEERESTTGRCLSNMVVQSERIKDKGSKSKSHRYEIRFIKASGQPAPARAIGPGVGQNASWSAVSTNSFLESQLQAGDPIIVSSEANQYMLGAGFVLEVKADSILVALDRPLRGVPIPCDEFDPVSNQNYEAIMEIRPTAARARSHTADGSSSAEPSEETVVSDIFKVPSALKGLRDDRMAAGEGVPDSGAGRGKQAVRFRIDLDELMTGMTLVRSNLLRLLAADGSNVKQRRLIIDLEPPMYRQLDPAELETLRGSQRQMERLNINQQEVVRKVLAAQDYALVLGMPGTGKTTTISMLVKLLVSQGKSVLITSYTHSAIDNILLKLIEGEDGEETARLRQTIIRLGNKDKIHSAIIPYTPDEANLKTVRQMDQFYMGKRIVATTCLGIRHPLFEKQHFDYCIVDEATQITLPVCVGPLRSADIFVLVGDHYQLPPLVHNLEAKEHGLVNSLFKYLCQAHPSAIVPLEYQYRMNREIQMLANYITYDNRLKCGVASVAAARLKLGVPVSALRDEMWKPGGGDGNDSSRTSSCVSRQSTMGEAQRAGGTTGNDWLEQVVDPDRPVVFADTDSVPAIETRNSADYIHNETEVKLVALITVALLELGVAGERIGVMSPFRAQLKQIEHEFKSVLGPVAIPSTVEVDTIDRFQGRDKDVIIMSWVRSNKVGSSGRLLQDWRRINVAVSRAKHKFIMIGSQSTLRSTPVLDSMIKFVREKGWVLNLPKAAHKQYRIPPHLIAVGKSASGGDDQTADHTQLDTERQHPAGSQGGSGKAGRAQTITAGTILKSRPIIDNVVSEQQ